MGRAGRLTSVLFAVGVLWLQPGLTPGTCSQNTALNVHICSTCSQENRNLSVSEAACDHDESLVFNLKQSKYKQVLLGRLWQKSHAFSFLN